MKWPVKKLGDICEIISGATPSTSVKEYWGDDFFWATPKDLSDLNVSDIKTTSRKISALGLKNCAATLLPINSVLFSSRAPIGLVAINTVPIATNQGFKNLVPNKNLVDARYLYHWLTFNRKNIDAMGVGATFKEVSKAIVSKIEIPLPPLTEQQRIAAVLDTADRILKLRESAIAKLEELEQSIFIEFFNMSDATEISIAEMLSKKILLLHKDGNHGGNYPKSDQFGDVGIPFLTAKCISESGQINEESIELLNKESANKLTIGWIEDGDVLLAHNASVGKVALYAGMYEKALIGTSLTAFRPNQKYLTSDYLFAALRSSKFQSQLTKNMGQTTRNQVPITAQRRLSFCIPCLELQIKFSERMKRIRIQRVDQIRAAAKNIQLVSSLQYQSFAVN
jgi:type I restriction enzyme S subunit